MMYVTSHRYSHVLIVKWCQKLHKVPPVPKDVPQNNNNHGTDTNNNAGTGEKPRNGSDQQDRARSYDVPESKMEVESGLVPVLENLAPKPPVPSLAEVTRAVTKLQNGWRRVQLGSLFHVHHQSSALHCHSD